MQLAMKQTSSPSSPAFPIPRIAAEAPRKRLAGYPILAITGPRQSGKTTLSRLIAPELPYYSLEDPDTRALATEDPRAFLRHASDGAKRYKFDIMYIIEDLNNLFAFNELRIDLFVLSSM